MLDTLGVKEALDRIVASAGFANSPRMSRFLRFVVEETAAGRASALKEYIVGVRVFDKAESFDPSVDPTVRVEASKLRAKLTRYYETDGRNDRVLIDIPKGHYSATLRIREPESRADTVEPLAPTSRSLPSPLSKREIVAWGLVVTMGLALLGGALALRGAGPPPSRDRVVRFHLHPPSHVRVGDLRTYGPSVISPDGRRLAFVGLDARGHSAIWLRDLDELTVVGIKGTTGASYPFWSPDGSQLAYFADRRLKRVRIGNGVPDVLDDAPIGRSGTWSADGTIVFVPSPDSPLRTISTTDGGRTRAAAMGGSTPGVAHLHPTFLPDGYRFLFVKAGPIAAVGVPFVGAVGSAREPAPYWWIPETHSNVVYAAAGDTSHGYLLYVRAASLMAQPVDARSLEPRGEARLVATGVRSSLSEAEAVTPWTVVINWPAGLTSR